MQVPIGWFIIFGVAAVISLVLLLLPSFIIWRSIHRPWWVAGWIAFVLILAGTALVMGRQQYLQAPKSATSASTNEIEIEWLEVRPTTDSQQQLVVFLRNPAPVAASVGLQVVSAATEPKTLPSPAVVYQASQMVPPGYVGEAVYPLAGYPLLPGTPLNLRLLRLLAEGDRLSTSTASHLLYEGSVMHGRAAIPVRVPATILPE